MANQNGILGAPQLSQGLLGLQAGTTTPEQLNSQYQLGIPFLPTPTYSGYQIPTGADANPAENSISKAFEAYDWPGVIQAIKDAGKWDEFNTEYTSQGFHPVTNLPKSDTGSWDVRKTLLEQLNLMGGDPSLPGGGTIQTASPTQLPWGMRPESMRGILGEQAQMAMQYKPRSTKV